MKSVIIVAGGIGKRMGGSVPKQLMPLKGRPLLCWTIEAFRAYDPTMPIIVVLPELHIAIWKALCIGHHFDVEHEVIAGGEERFHSVRNGLAAVTSDGVVAVHDGVRPLVSVELITRCFEAAEKYGTAIPVVRINNSVRRLDGGRNRAIDRSKLRAVQTPQVFRADILREAFALPYEPAFTDEATLVERLGVSMHLVEGEERNIKVTAPLDLQIAETLVATGH